MNLTVLTNIEREKYYNCFIDTVKKLIELRFNIILDKKFKDIIDCGAINWCDDEYEIIKSADIAVIIGGDGTIMRYSKLAAKFNTKVLGINMGRLGFISSLENNELNKLSNVIKGFYTIDKRILFEFKDVENNKKFLSLNEIVISRNINSQIIDYSIYKGNNNICNFRSDGIILSTPTGSTAYSMSAGGPIVEPGIECAIITPIFPHSLNSRSLIVGLDTSMRVKYELRDGSEVNIISDGDLCFNSKKSGEIEVKKSEIEVEFISLDENRFYKNLKQKLIK